MKLPTFSVVIPTKNEEKWLPDVLVAVALQTLRPLEVIIADADSTDGTRAVAEKFGARVVSGGLPGVGRNRGAAAAKGDLLVFLDADVILPDPQFFTRAVTEFAERDLDMATADVTVSCGTFGDRIGMWIYNTYARLMVRLRPHTPGFFIVIRRALHESIHGFDETILFAEDQDYGNRAARLGVFQILDTVKIGTTTRRQERDGRLHMWVIYLLSELHMIFLGPIRHNAFRYGFGHDAPIAKAEDDSQEST